jgi:hypothetical protein
VATKTEKLSKAALQFVDPQCFAAANTKEEQPKLEMTVYSGGVIPNHWYWGDLAIDLSGMSFPKAKTPILEDHNTSKKIGFSTKMSTEGNKLSVAESVFLDTPESLVFRSNSAAGFPYEASMYVRPTSVEEVGNGVEVDVNGFKFKGPGTIWRKSIFKEASVCTFGYDPNTRSAAMSEGEEECIFEVVSKSEENLETPNREEKTSMNLEKLKAEHPELYAQIMAAGEANAKAQFSAVQVTLEKQITTLTEENTKLSQENKDGEKRLLALEKSEAIRTEKAISESADNIFNAQFKETSLPVRLHEKIRKLVSHEKFVADGVFDTEAFKAAVDTELTDWNPSNEGSVLGFSSTSKDYQTDESKLQDKASDAIVDRMLRHIGQEAK